MRIPKLLTIEDLAGHVHGTNRAIGPIPGEIMEQIARGLRLLGSTYNPAAVVIGEFDSGLYIAERFPIPGQVVLDQELLAFRHYRTGKILAGVDPTPSGAMPHLATAQDLVHLARKGE